MNNEQDVNPWSVKGEKNEDVSLAINYDKLIDQFGCQRITEQILTDLRNITKLPAHHLLERGVVFAHRDFHKIIEAIKEGKKFYIYTGRGPSSASLHLGHIVPFIFCKYLQEAFDVPLVIQITDDEKFLWKNMSLDDATRFAKENIKDIIALGFNPDKTYVFINSEYSHKFIRNSLKIGKAISLREASKVFGFNDGFSVSQIEFPVREIAPCFASSFDFLDNDMLCLVPSGIDQDPFFRLARDKAHILSAPKPCTIYLTFLPDLNGMDSKMSASDLNSSIFLTDTPEDVKTKIIKYAFSGGRDTMKEHRELGGNLDVDVSYHYLRYFLEDGDKLKNIADSYSSGKMTTSELKKECIDVITKFLGEYQAKRKMVDDQKYNLFLLNPNK